MDQYSFFLEKANLKFPQFRLSGRAVKFRNGSVFVSLLLSSSSSGGRAFCGMREGLSDPGFRFLKRGP